MLPKIDGPVISFAGGLPAASSFPKAALAKSYERVLLNQGEEVLQYHNADGLLPLRERLAEQFQTENMAVSADEIVLTQGAQQGIELIGKLFINPGDTIAVEAPTYIGALAAFSAYEPNYLEMPLASDGPDLDVLEAGLKKEKIKFIYVVPNFQNPTGAVISLAKRRRLLDLANQYDTYILEDDPYRYLRFAGESLPTLKSMDTTGKVISLGSFSKILAPGLRLGWMIADPKIISQVINLKMNSDLETPTVTQAVVLDYLEHNDFAAHLQTLQDHYREQRDHMLAAINQYLPSVCTHTVPEGGFFLWITAPKEVNMDHLLKTKLAPIDHVLYVPSTHLYASKNIFNGARLSYAGGTRAQFDEGIQVIAKGIEAALKKVEI